MKKNRTKYQRKTGQSIRGKQDKVSEENRTKHQRKTGQRIIEENRTVSETSIDHALFEERSIDSKSS